MSRSRVILKERAVREARVERPTTATAATSNIMTTITIAVVWQRQRRFAGGSGREKLKTTAAPYGIRE